MKKSLVILALSVFTASAQQYVTMTISNSAQVASVNIPPGDVCRIENVSVIPSGANLVPAQIELVFTNGVAGVYGVQVLNLNSASGFNQMMPLNSPLAGVARVSLTANPAASYDPANSPAFATIEYDAGTSNAVTQSEAATLSISPGKVIAVNGSPSASVVLQSSADFSAWQPLATGSPPYVVQYDGPASRQFFRAVNQ